MTENEYRARLKAAHLCLYCKKQDAYTLAGRRHCAECAEKDRMKAARYRSEHPGRNAENCARRVKHLKEDGICRLCGQRKADEGYVTCGICRARQRAYTKNYRRKRGVRPRLQGVICWQCNKKTVMPGKGVCEACYGWKVETVLKNRPKDNSGHPWRD